MSNSSIAACVTVGGVTTCDATAPNPWTTAIGDGDAASADGQTVTVTSGSQIVVGDESAISLRDNAVITINSGATISATSVSIWGNYGSAGNTIEFRDNGILTVEAGAQVLALGTQTNAEAVNFQGTGNTLINNGYIYAANAAAIWSQSNMAVNTVINNATGIIEAGDGLTDSVIGATSGGTGAYDFTNYGTVRGSIILTFGDDILRLYTGSTVTGMFNGSAGDDTIYLSGAGSSTLPGDILEFETLIKNDTGTWTLAGDLVGWMTTEVQNGTLVLTGDNSGYGGSMTVDPAGTLEVRARSLPSSVTNNGLLRFAQPDAGTYSGTISGTGAVEKTGAGVLTLTPNLGGNTYTGGTTIREGVLATAVDNALGDTAGGLTFDGGTFRFNDAFDLALTRAVTMAAGGGGIDTQDLAITITQGITGVGALTKLGSGTLVLNGDNTHLGGTTVAAGTLIVGDAATPAAALSGGGTVRVNAGATLGGYGSITGDTENRGVIAVANALSQLSGGPNANFTINGNLSNYGTINLAGAAIGNTLTVLGNYTGSGGTIALNTYLDTDGSPSDLVIIDGGVASGSTALLITNLGGAGGLTSGDGILVVEAVNGATTTAGAFTLGSAVSVGTTEYLLFRGDSTGAGENWYLRNTDENGQPFVRPEVAAYSVIPPVLRISARETLGTFHERRGAQDILSSGDNFSAAWGRVFGQDITQQWAGTVDPSINGSLWGIQAGLDFVRTESDSGHRNIAGLFVGHTRLDASTRGHAISSGDMLVGKVDANASSVGAYWTHIASSGWYLDGVLMGSFFDGSAQTYRAVGVDTDGTGFTASLEGGYPIALGQGWVLEPQAQLIWQTISVDDQNDGYSDVRFETDDSLTARVGARLQNTVETPYGTIQPYVKANLWHESKGTDQVYFDSELVETNIGGTIAELGGGVTVNATANLSFYATADYRFEVSGEKQRLFDGNVGLRLKW